MYMLRMHQGTNISNKHLMQTFNNSRMKVKKYSQDINEVYTPLKSRPKGLSRKNETELRRQEVQKCEVKKKSMETNAHFKKSIEVSISQPTRPTQISTIVQPSTLPNRSYYRRISHNFKKGLRRYEEEQTSPYLKRELRTTLLNRSNNKIRSGQLKQAAPIHFYRQPRSSLSQHYDPSFESSLHKRRVSLISEEHSTLIDEAKELYRVANYTKSIEVLRKYVRAHRDSIEGNYLLGMSLINTNQLLAGIEQLKKTIELDAQYKRSIYLVIALALKKSNKFQQAIQILSKGLELFPGYYDCLVYRGKLFLRLEKYDLALADFTKAIEDDSEKGFAYVGKGTCEIELKMNNEAINTFTKGLRTDMGYLCHEKKGILLYEAKKYDDALKHLDSALKHGPSSTAFYYKGMIHYFKQEKVQAMLGFEQALRCDNNKESLTKSVEMMFKIKVEEKDFYQAYHILTRADSVDIQKQAIQDWKLFLEGSLFLMKKKYKEGIQTYGSLLRSLTNKDRDLFLKPLIYLYKAFGFLNEKRTEQAKKQYEKHTAFCKLHNIPDDNLSKLYNTLIMEAYDKFPNSSKALQQAIKLIPTKPQPYLLLAFTIIHNGLPGGLKNTVAQEAIECISIGISQLPQLSNNHISTFYYFRAILQLYQGQFNKSVVDIDKAIQKSEDNIPKYFHLRGLIFACFGNFSQGVQDLSVAINLDEKFNKSYLERAKCLQIQGNSNEAFLDLQKYITLTPNDNDIHKYAGFLLFQNCAYEDCLAAFKHGSDLVDTQILVTKAKCNFLLANYSHAIQQFKEHDKNDSLHQYKADIILIQICDHIRNNAQKDALRRYIKVIAELIQTTKQENCRIFKLRDMHQITASLHLLLGEYEEAIVHFNSTLQLFKVEKKKEEERNIVEDSQQFEDQWSEVEIKFNLSLCMVAQKKYEEARELLLQFEGCSQKGKNWNKYMNLLDDLLNNMNEAKQTIEIDTFEQNHRISKDWPKLSLAPLNVKLSLAFSYPFVQPPELIPCFDTSLFAEFVPDTTEHKPEAPWINRCEKGLVFTPNVQVYDNLQLSVTTLNQQTQKKHASEMDRSVNISQSSFQLETDDLKKKFKLDSATQMKLNKIMKQDK